MHCASTQRPERPQVDHCATSNGLEYEECHGTKIRNKLHYFLIWFSYITLYVCCSFELKHSSNIYRSAWKCVEMILYQDIQCNTTLFLFIQYDQESIYHTGPESLWNGHLSICLRCHNDSFRYLGYAVYERKYCFCLKNLIFKWPWTMEKT